MKNQLNSTNIKLKIQMKSTRLPDLSAALFLSLTMLVTSCSKQEAASNASAPANEPVKAKPFEGQIFRTADDRQAITLVSQDELEMRGGDAGAENLICKYTKQDDTLRVVKTMLGTTLAVYYKITPEGLKANEGTVLFNRAWFARTAWTQQWAGVDAALMERHAAVEFQQVKAQAESAAGLTAKQPEQAAQQFDAATAKLNALFALAQIKENLVFIRSGSFSMGEGNEKHQVTLTKPFYMGKYEVTQEQWQAVMGSNPSEKKGAKNPVENVSWNDCQSFVAKLNEKLPGLKASLPTEAQWEYACRAGSATKFCYGDDEAGLAEYAWYSVNAGDSTHPVGQKTPNAWGLYDMMGNVYEWCLDWSGSLPAGNVTDPQGPGSGSSRVFRGGCWHRNAFDCRAAGRGSSFPASRGYSLGFRVVLAQGQ